MRLHAPLLAVLALAALAPPIGATHWTCSTEMLVDLDGRAYVVVTDLLDSYIVDYRVYREANGVPGLQRGGWSMLAFAFYDEWPDCLNWGPGHDEWVA